MGSPRMFHAPVRVAVIQPRGFPFDPDAAIDEVVRGVEREAKAGVDLVLYPEAVVGGDPGGLTFGTSIGGRTE